MHYDLIHLFILQNYQAEINVLLSRCLLDKCLFPAADQLIVINNQ